MLLVQAVQANDCTAIFIHRRITNHQVKMNTQLNSTSVQISIDQNKIRISVVYKRPQNPLDLDLLTNGCDWFIIAGDMTAKHLLWNSNGANPVGHVLYRHV